MAGLYDHGPIFPYFSPCLQEDDCNESGMSVSSSEWTKVDRDTVAAAAAQMPAVEPDPEDWGSWE